MLNRTIEALIKFDCEKSLSVLVQESHAEEHCYNINLFLCINNQFALSSTHLIKLYYE